MEVFLFLMGENLSKVYVYKFITTYTLSVLKFCQLNLSKAEK